MNFYQEEKRKRLEVDIDFAPEDLALATVPGADFDPRRRAFDVDELRPQPIIRCVLSSICNIITLVNLMNVHNHVAQNSSAPKPLSFCEQIINTTQR